MQSDTKNMYKDTAIENFPLSKMEYDDQQTKTASILSRKGKV